MKKVLGFLLLCIAREWQQCEAQSTTEWNTHPPTTSAYWTTDPPTDSPTDSPTDPPVSTTMWPAEGCPPGWIDSIEGCFLFHYTKYLTWAEAQLECELLGGYLAEPKSVEQAALLTSLAYLEQGVLGVEAWWVGLTDRGHEGRWIWQHSVEDASYTNWAPGSPGGNEVEKDCAILNFDHQFKWTDENCLHALAGPICQRGEVDVTTPATEASTTTDSMYRLELQGGDGWSSGNVYANANGYFGPVCDDGWGNNDARVVCRQLGFADGNYTTGSYFGTVSTSEFAMDNVMCEGTEEHLQDCTYLSSDDCRASEGAGVYCGN